MRGDTVKEARWQERAARLFCVCVYFTAVLLALKYLLPVIAPFLIAYAVSAVVAPAAKRLSRLTRIPNAICCAVILAMALSAVGVAAFYACRQLVIEIGKAVNVLSADGFSALAPVFRMLEDMPILSSLAGVSEEYVFGELPPLLTNALSMLSSHISELMGRTVRATPSALLSGLVTLMSCYYLSVDRDRIRGWISSILPQVAAERAEKLRRGAVRTVGRYLKAYAKIFLLTFLEVLAGLLLLCPSYACLGALAVAAVDILPVLGAGLVLIPWGVVALVSGDVFLGAGLLVLYVIVSVIRQIAEPRIIGKAVGIHPFASLAAMYIGYKLFGAIGMLLSPIAFICIKGALGHRQT